MTSNNSLNTIRPTRCQRLEVSSSFYHSLCTLTVGQPACTGKGNCMAGQCETVLIRAPTGAHGGQAKRNISSTCSGKPVTDQQRC